MQFPKPQPNELLLALSVARILTGALFGPGLGSGCSLAILASSVAQQASQRHLLTSVATEAAYCSHTAKLQSDFIMLKEVSEVIAYD